MLCVLFCCRIVTNAYRRFIGDGPTVKINTVSQQDGCFEGSPENRNKLSPGRAGQEATQPAVDDSKILKLIAENCRQDNAAKKVKVFRPLAPVPP
jgi:hypothetical protein